MVGARHADRNRGAPCEGTGERWRVKGRRRVKRDGARHEERGRKRCKWRVERLRRRNSGWVKYRELRAKRRTEMAACRGGGEYLSGEEKEWILQWRFLHGGGGAPPPPSLRRTAALCNE